MYPSSSNQRPTTAPSGLTRYVSAPGSLLTSVVNSVLGNQDGDHDHDDDEFSDTIMNHHRYFAGDSSSLTTDSSCKTNGGAGAGLPDLQKDQGFRNQRGSSGNLERSYGFNQIPAGGGGGGGGGDFAAATNLRIGGGGSGGGGDGGGGGGGASSSLLRQSSSPAGFFNSLRSENGFSITNGVGGYRTQVGPSSHARLKSQLSFTRQDSLSQISEVGESVAGVSNSDASGSFTMSPWDDSNEIVFSNPAKRAKNINSDFVNALSDLESQSLDQWLPKTSLEVANMEKILQMQSDKVPCRTRAKRGFATHPRSIAERERRGRISENLRKLQELVPNMDKQTSTSDMLDLAVQHIKGLQGEVQKLNKDLEKCSCGCKHEQER